MPSMERESENLLALAPIMLYGIPSVAAIERLARLIDNRDSPRLSAETLIGPEGVASDTTLPATNDQNVR